MTNKQELVTQPALGGLMVPTVPSQMGIATVEDVELLEATFAGMPITEWKLPRAKKPSGVKTFVLEVSGQATSPAKITGTIVALRPISKAWFRSPATAKGVPPSCVSHDGLRGYGIRDVAADKDAEETWGDCVSCPWNKMGSKRTVQGGRDKGKDCGDTVVLLVSVPGLLTPVTIQVTPGSLGNWQEFILGLLNVRTADGNRARPQDCVVTFGLESATRPDGQSYNKVTFKLEGLAEKGDVTERASKLFSEMLQQSRAIELVAPDEE